HDFRPDYSKLGEIREQLGNPLTLALTATATPEVQKDILTSLNIPKAPIHSDGLARPNLAIQIKEAYGLEEKLEELEEALKKHHGLIIVYIALIETLKKDSRELQKTRDHLILHGKLQGNIRRKNLKRFMKEESPLMSATPAFGLGID